VSGPARADFPAAEEGEFYWVDLIGCAVVNEQGEALGEVTGLIDNGAHQILQVAYELPDGKAAERLIRLSTRSCGRWIHRPGGSWWTGGSITEVSGRRGCSSM
jgi:hypothetical protein